MASSSNPQRSIWLLAYGCEGPSIEASALKKYNPSFEADECHTVVVDGVTKYTLIHLIKRKQLSFVENFMEQYSSKNGVAVQKSIYFADAVASSGLLDNAAFKAMVLKYQESRGAGVEGVFTTWIERQKLRGGGMIASYCSGLMRKGNDDDDEKLDEVRQEETSPDDLQVENEKLRKELRSASSRLRFITGLPMVRVGERMTIPLNAGPCQPEQNIYHYMDLAYKSAIERNEAEDQLDIARSEICALERKGGQFDMSALATKLEVALKEKATLTSRVVSSGKQVRAVEKERDQFKFMLTAVGEELCEVKEMLDEVTVERDDLGKKYDELIITMIEDGKNTGSTIDALKAEIAELKEGVH